MVNVTIPPGLGFQHNKTSVLLMPALEVGCAKKGAIEVMFHGLKEMRNLTAGLVINGGNELISLTQNIWGGVEFMSHPCTAAKKMRDNMTNHIVTEMPAKGLCPSPAVEAAHSEWLWHCQTETHWCCLNSLKMLIN